MAGLCPVVCLQSYERATAGMREGVLAVISEHKVVCLGERFSAHSGRSVASTVAALSGGKSAY